MMCQRVKQKVEPSPAELPNGVCCEEHRRQLMKFSELSQILPNVDMTDLAFYFARQCQNNKKAARTARRLTAVSQRAPMPEDKRTSPFHIVDHLLASPTGIYGMELNSRPFHEFCSPQELRVTFERYGKALKFEDYNVIPFAFDVQLKFRSLSFLSKEQIFNRLMSMTRVNLRETKINRVHKDSMIHVHSIVDPFVTPRAIQSIVQDKNGNFIRLSIYNWYTTLTDQSDEQIRNRLKAERHFIIGNPFVKMAADGLLTLRVDNPRLEMWFTDYEKELEQMDADRLRDLGNKCFATDDTHSAIEYYTLGLTKSPLDTRILTNRAECYLQSQLPHLALIDCDRILKIYADNPTVENTDVRFTWKVHFRRMRALISLQLYDLAKAAGDPMVSSAQAVSGAHSEIVDRFRRMIDTDVPRLQRESTGHYEMKDFLVEPMKKSDAFVAEFERTDAYEFRACDQQEKGFGLFALSPLQPGTLLLVERSFADVPIKSNEELVDESSHQILFALTQKNDHRSGGEGSTAAGKYLRQTSLELLKKMEIRILIDPKQSLEKLAHLTPLRLHVQRQKSDDEDEYHVLPYRMFFELYERNVIGPGLWPKLSRFNHSCLPNCYFLLINQLCFVSVLKPIGIGEELTISYLPSVYSSYIERTLRLRDYYIDECQCSLCSYDRKIGQADMQQLCRQFEENEDDEDKRRYLFKNLIYRYGSSRPLGFVEQLNQLKRSVNIEIFVEQVKHGYLTHPFILNYLLSHLDKYEKLKSIFQMLDEEFAYFNWPIVDQRQRWTALIELLLQLLQN